ncbi:MAG: prenyltransferase/squalene oxidase repeat-containing protein [Planctomycetota bacterium]
MLPRGSTPTLCCTLALIAIVGGWGAPRPVRAQQSAPPPGRSAADDAGGAWELPPEAKRAIDESVEWLAAQQFERSGRWAAKPPQFQMSVTALAGLALLAHGVTPDSGPHAETLRRCLLWVLDAQKTDEPFAGLLCDSKEPMAESERPMHGHGFALLLLGQAYGTSRDPVLRERIHRAIALGVRLTERTISPAGGWFYWPSHVRGNARDEGSVTITQIQALRSARNAGVAVSASVVERAVSYIKRSQNPDGGVRYMLRPSSSPASAALTSAGIVVLQDAGEYHGDAIERAYGYLRTNLRTDLPEEQKWFFYTHLYASQAMFQRGGASWKAYFPKIRNQLLEMRQGAHWESRDVGPAYATAMALLILQLPNRFLPIHQR